MPADIQRRDGLTCRCQVDDDTSRFHVFDLGCNVTVGDWL